MTREELKAHCLNQIEMCKTWAVGKGEEPSGKIYEEHKLILELLEQEAFINKPCCISGEVCEHDKNIVLDKIRAEIFEEMFSHSGTGEEVIQAYSDGLKKGLEIFDKYNGKK